ncbi:MAG: rhodanese-like domain-containing protein [Verrucomicrobia bacterium]|nr:rhodanese-like domain-containing protein [Verrucomicrobiota bacterium]MDA1065024.1 rhodanese-like domain-containing protein [Verrucomicrobiota bacterium]
MKIQSRFTLLPIILLSLLTGFTACSEKAASETVEIKVVDVQPDEAAKRLANESIVVLDVRTPEEVAMGRIPGSININITGPDFSEGIAKLDSSKTYMVHCAAGSVGGRSRRSIDALEAIGVKNVYHLEGGFAGWLTAKNEVEVPGK